MKVGIVGSGQLGWMMILEGRPAGHRFHLTGRDPTSPSASIADRFYPVSKYRKFVDSVDVVTYEFESVDPQVIEYADRQGKLFPPASALQLKWDRTREMEFLKRAGLPIPDYRVARSRGEIRRFAREYGKAVVKACSGGYDGKGVRIYTEGLRVNCSPERPFLVQEFVDFDSEASVIGARDARGHMVFFPPSSNVNLRGILVSNYSPGREYGMTEIARTVLSRLNYVGVMAIEFMIRNGKALVNEIAPRVHNSGHHTLYGSSLSQFDLHLRAITGTPLVEPRLFRPAGMVNILGRRLSEEATRKILRMDTSRIYWYGKEGVRRRRKLGHVNVVSDTVPGVKASLQRVMNILYPGGTIQDYL
jgi:5-(carboxyamino)imidazole ribonucleotide synthase